MKRCAAMNVVLCLVVMFGISCSGQRKVTRAKKRPPRPLTGEEKKARSAQCRENLGRIAGAIKAYTYAPGNRMLETPAALDDLVPAHIKSEAVLAVPGTGKRLLFRRPALEDRVGKPVCWTPWGAIEKRLVLVSGSVIVEVTEAEFLALMKKYKLDPEDWEKGLKEKKAKAKKEKKPAPKKKTPAGKKQPGKKKGAK